jgi:hypothetical protein
MWLDQMINQIPICTSCSNKSKYFCLFCNKGICGRCKRRKIAKKLEFGLCLDPECLGYRLDSTLNLIYDDSFHQMIAEFILDLSQPINHQKILSYVLDLTQDVDENIKENAICFLQAFKDEVSVEERKTVIDRLFQIYRERDCKEDWRVYGSTWASVEAVNSFITFSKNMSVKELESYVLRLIEMTYQSDLNVQVCALRSFKGVEMELLSMHHRKTLVTRLLELITHQESYIRRATIPSLGLGNGIPPKLRGTVVINLLNLCNETEYSLDEELAGRTFKELSKYWDLGDAIPQNKRAITADLVKQLDSKEALYISYEVDKDDDDWGGNAYNWKNPWPKYEKESLIHLFQNLLNSNE